MPVLRIASVDDDTATRLGLALLLPMFDFVGQYSSVRALLSDQPDVDVVMLDLGLDASGPNVQGSAAVRAVARAGHRVLIYTNEPRRDVLAWCFSQGAQGLVEKSEPMDAVERAVRAVAAGRTVLTQEMIGLVALADRRGLIGGLTSRQREVLSARARGESFASIGERLFISPRTAEDHWAHVAHKFSEYLVSHSPADLERMLGIGPGDVLDDPGT